jgi:hypothetical protein
VWVKNISSSSNGSIISNKATQGSSALTASYNIGVSSYTLTVAFSLDSYNPTTAFSIIVRGSISVDGPCLIWLFYNGTITLSNVPVAANVSNTPLYPAEAYTSLGSHTAVVTVTPATVAINIDGGAYTKSVNTTLYASATAIGIQTNGSNSSVDSINVI